MSKREITEMGERYANIHWATGRGFYCVSGMKGWRDAAYRSGYESQWKALEGK